MLTILLPEIEDDIERLIPAILFCEDDVCGS